MITGTYNIFLKVKSNAMELASHRALYQGDDRTAKDIYINALELVVQDINEHIEDMKAGKE